MIMPMYLESLDGSQSYRADMFCGKRELIDGQIYSLEELVFSDWLKTAGTQHKPPQKKLKANWYGPKLNDSTEEKSE
jgi:hypothetical protein